MSGKRYYAYKHEAIDYSEYDFDAVCYVMKDKVPEELLKMKTNDTLVVGKDDAAHKTLREYLRYVRILNRAFDVQTRRHRWSDGVEKGYVTVKKYYYFNTLI